jgi:hypothetical protein
MRVDKGVKEFRKASDISAIEAVFLLKIHSGIITPPKKQVLLAV